MLQNYKFDPVVENHIKFVENRLAIHFKYVEIAILKYSGNKLSTKSAISIAGKLGANYVLKERDYYLFIRTLDIPSKSNSPKKDHVEI
jgi:hypothetical protein